jgi:hypothetical protein
MRCSISVLLFRFFDFDSLMSFDRKGVTGKAVWPTFDSFGKTTDLLKTLIPSKTFLHQFEFDQALRCLRQACHHSGISDMQGASLPTSWAWCTISGRSSRYSRSRQPAPPFTPYASQHSDLLRNLHAPRNLPTHPSAVDRSAARAGVSAMRMRAPPTPALRHGHTKAQQLSHHIHSSVSHPTAPTSLPRHLTCHSAANARNTSAHRVTQLPLWQSGKSCK